MSAFVFESYDYNDAKAIATFRYSDGAKRTFTERLSFPKTHSSNYDHDVFNRALFLAFLVIGTSYYKAFPTREVVFNSGAIDQLQADFLDKVYQEGLGQYAYENKLSRDDLAHFQPTTAASQGATEYAGEGVLALQSGGKDSLLMATLLQERNIPFTSLYVTSGKAHPEVLDQLPGKLLVVRREIDKGALLAAEAEGGRNGHVPVTYIVLAIATLQAILLGKQMVVASIGHEGEEPHAHIGDLAVSHQWSKTWPAEHLFAAYVKHYVAPSLLVGSPLRSFSEFRISQMFADLAWQSYGHSFSSCNVANYAQGANNQKLRWCGECPKCANAFLLFAPFVAHEELIELFDGKDLFAQKQLNETFKGLLGVDDVMKPFECVGEIDELRSAYHLSESNGYARLPFTVPASTFDIEQVYEAQPWASQLLESTPGTM